MTSIIHTEHHVEKWQIHVIEMDCCNNTRVTGTTSLWHGKISAITKLFDNIQLCAEIYMQIEYQNWTKFIISFKFMNSKHSSIIVLNYELKSSNLQKFCRNLYKILDQNWISTVRAFLLLILNKIDKRWFKMKYYNKLLQKIGKVLNYKFISFLIYVPICPPQMNRQIFDICLVRTFRDLFT